MKLSSAFLMISAMASTAASMKISGKNAAKVLRAARRVEEQAAEGDDAQEGEYEYLTKYTLKVVGCKQGEEVVDAETGEYEYNAVVFRLCPTDAGCSDDITEGCESNYGDFVVGLNTYVEAFFEDQRDNMNWDDGFDVDRYSKCEMYEQEFDDDQAAAQWENYQFYIGPTCVDNDVRLAVFEDEYCTYESETSFYEISNGWALPFEDGGMVSTQCTDCLEANDNGAYELREMCQNVYQASQSKCESQMEYYSYYGKNEQGCEYVQTLLPEKTSDSNAGKVFGWIIFVLLIGGLAGYIVWWRKKKAGASEGL